MDTHGAEPEKANPETASPDQTTGAKSVGEKNADGKRSQEGIRTAVWAAACILVLLALGMLLLFLATVPVSSTDFRLMARSDIIGLELKTQAKFRVKVSNWSVRGIDSIASDDGHAPPHKTNNEPLSLMPDSSPPAPGSNERRNFAAITVTAPATSILRMTSTQGSDKRFRLEFSRVPVEVLIEMPKRDSQVLVEAPKEAPQLLRVSEALTLNTMRSGSVLELEPHDDAPLTLMLAVPVSAFGFAKPRTDISAEGDTPNLPGLLDGRIQFLDLPNTELPLFPGSDVRFRVKETTTVDRLDLTVNGIHTSISGKAETIDLVIGGGSRSLMPKWWDRIANLPETSIALGVTTGLTGALSLILTFFQLRTRFSKLWSRPRERT
jgi:hypothetical protein